MSMRVIAEIGLHHGGNVRRAEDLITSAAACGVQAVKLQYFTEQDLRERPKGTGWDMLERD